MKMKRKMMMKSKMKSKRKTTKSKFQLLDERRRAARKIGRSARSGKFMSVKEAGKRKTTAVVETIKPESGWLIEHGSSSVSSPHYWTGDGDAWTEDNLEAVRFARKLDAERVANGLLSNLTTRVCEHIWD